MFFLEWMPVHCIAAVRSTSRSPFFVVGNDAFLECSRRPSNHRQCGGIEFGRCLPCNFRLPVHNRQRAAEFAARMKKSTTTTTTTRWRYCLDVVVVLELLLLHLLLLLTLTLILTIAVRTVIPYRSDVPFRAVLAWRISNRQGYTTTQDVLQVCIPIRVWFPEPERDCR